VPTREEVLRALTGTLLLARQDPRAEDFFDLSLDGFWKSFFAAVVGLPFFLVLVLNELALLEPLSPFAVVAARLVAYALDWPLFALAAALLVRLVDLSRRYVPLVVMVNWATVPQLALMAATVAVAAVLPDAVAGFLFVVALTTVLFYRWTVMRRALGGLGGTAFGFLVVDVLLGVFTERLITTLFGMD